MPGDRPVPAGPVPAGRARLARRPVSAAMVGAIDVYRLAVSPWIGPACRFEPSCSAYGAEAIRRHGPLRGLILTLRRLARCHPWGGSGYDPVPPKLHRLGPHRPGPHRHAA